MLNLLIILPIILIILFKFVAAILPNIKQQSYMDNFKNQLEQLQCIVDSCDKLRSQILFEEKVLNAELVDRLVKDLHGAEAIEHFNSYMRLFGLGNMVIELDGDD